jgi:hypothetical protein
MPSILCVVSEAEEALSGVEPTTFDGKAFGGEEDDG